MLATGSVPIDRTRGNSNCFKLQESQFALNIRKRFFYSEGGKTLAQVAKKNGGCLILGNIQGQGGTGLCAT